MKYFLDTEFIENGPGQPIWPISIGIVAEDGRELYFEWQDHSFELANDWVKANVLPHLKRGDTVAPRRHIWAAILDFIGSDSEPEFWGYYAAYDWVVFCQIFLVMVNLPKGWPMYCRDIKWWCDILGNPKLPKKESTEHNALNDALWNKRAWEFLRYYAKKCHICGEPTEFACSDCRATFPW